MRSGWKRAGAEGPGGSGHPQDGVCQYHTQQHPLHLQVRTIVGNKHNCPAGSATFLTPGSGMGKKNQDPLNIPDHISDSLETIFWVKNT
jgi:hypothetical protein